MDQQIVTATAGAAVAAIAFFHTITGPDHYLPFIMIGRVRKWPAFKTAILTLICGLGHVSSSIVLAVIAIFFGKLLTRIQWIEESRGELAAWLLIAFGFFYMVWGMKQAFRNREHTHEHEHDDGSVHEHVHSHYGNHLHVHMANEDTRKITPWVLFIIFVLGPCEPLIPLMLAPASQGNILGVVWVAALFSVITLATMLALVLGSLYGLNRISFKGVEKYAHALAGGSIMACGLAMQFLGL
ncbi:MAG: sulfite exporter TauE/SafE family protein [Victivallales bacterium]|nr:sulfite exporter TauE/SafE family protein [Victivallales bacterium]